MEFTNIEILGRKINAKDIVARNMFNKTILANNSILTVGAMGAKFTSINDAINKAKELGVSAENPIAIVVYPGDYYEQIVLSNVHGLSFIGFGSSMTRVLYDGAYPNCVVRVEGDVTFTGMSFKQLDPTAHCIHCDPVDANIEGTVEFHSCEIIGGVNGVGYGSGINTKLVLDNCVISGIHTCVYAHNSAYAGRQGQALEVRNCVFKHTVEEFLVEVDDAGATYGVGSQMNVLFCNNTHTGNGYGKIRFRKNTNVPSTWTGYIPYNDNNIIITTSSEGNAGIPGLNHYEGYFTKSTYVSISSNQSATDGYVGTIDVPFDINNYNVECRVYDIGAGEVTDDFVVFNRGNLSVSVRTNNPNHAGKTFSVELYCKCS